MRDILKINWEYEWERQMTFFVADDIFLAWKMPPKKYAYLLKTYFLMGKFDNIVEMYFDKKEIFDLSEKLLNKFIKYKLTDPWIKDCNLSCDKLKDYLFNRLNKLDIKKLSNNQLLSELKKYYFIYIETTAHIAVIRILNREIEKRLAKYFNECFKDQSKATEILNILTSPDQLSIDALEEVDLLKALKKIKQGESKWDQLLQKHLEKYLWMPVGYLDETEWDIKYLESRLNKITNLSSDDIDKRIRKIKRQTAIIHAKKKEVASKYKIDQQILAICKQSSYGAYFKDLIRERLNMAHYYSRPLFNEIAKRNNLTFTNIKTLGYEEIMRIFETNRQELKQKIRQRQKSYIILSLNGQRSEIYDQKTIKDFTKKLQNQDSSQTLNGIGVSLGQATGRVLKIKKQTIDIKGENYVLVTTMTTPELVPLMKKAVAVITDEGGLTCHAAIVSRELKIPCVVGTKIATQVLKDGDLIQVDANQGTVIKLK